MGIQGQSAAEPMFRTYADAERFYNGPIPQRVLDDIARRNPIDPVTPAERVHIARREVRRVIRAIRHCASKNWGVAPLAPELRDRFSEYRTAQAAIRPVDVFDISDGRWLYAKAVPLAECIDDTDERAHALTEIAAKGCARIGGGAAPLFEIVPAKVAA